MNTISDTKKTTQQIAKQVAKQMAEEPFEIFKKAGQQISGTEKTEDITREPEEKKPFQTREEVQLKQKIEVQGQRQMQALQKELEDIENQKLFNDLLKRVTEGEIIPLENFPQLSIEQKDVLKAQMEAVKMRKEEEKKEKPVEEPETKKSRKLFGFGSSQAEKQKTHVEKILPPSG
jgi:hypothetical protein